MTQASTSQQLCAGIDIKWLRDQPENVIEKWRENQRKRYRDPKLIDEVLGLDTQYRGKLKERVQLSTQKGNLMKQLNPKSPNYISDPEQQQALKDEAKAIGKQVDDLQVEVDQLFSALEAKLCLVGCMLHDSVPISDDEANNVTIRKCGRLPTFTKFYAHNQLLSMIDGYDPERGNRISGHRGYFLKGIALKLNQALIKYGIDFIMSRGFTPLHTPFFMKKEIMGRVCQLEDFAETLYQIYEVDEKGQVKPDDQLLLIATSEQPICGFHLNESLNEDELPKRYCGFSSCFRKEAGASGKDNWGIFRVHQFEKVEQFCITSPRNNESWTLHQEMVDNSCEFYMSLGIPFRAVLIVSKECNYSTSRKVDIEGWFPSFNEYRELVSASNCLDFQSRKMKIRFRPKQKSDEIEFVHMLNATLCATERTLCAILENYQTPDGIIVPKVLQPYLTELVEIDRPSEALFNDAEIDLREYSEKVSLLRSPKPIEFIPFVKPPPKGEKGSE